VPLLRFARFGKCDLVVQAGEDVEDSTLRGGGMADAVGGHERQLHGPRELHHRLIAPFLFAIQVPLQFNIDVVTPEQADESIESFAPGMAGERAFHSAGDTEQPVGEFREIIRGSSRFKARFRILRARAEFHAGDQATQVLIARAGFDEKCVAGLVGRRDFCAEVRADTVFACGLVEAGRAVEAIHVCQCHRLQAMGCRDIGIIFRHARPLQETKCRARMQFDVGGAH
jgi:hypothetical protein